jgi:phage major head subunit gpT-like protein
MPGIVNPSQLLNARIVVNARHRKAYQETPDDLMWYKAIAEEVPSSSDAQAYFVEHTIPRLRKWVGARHVRGIKREAVTVYNENYEGTLGIPVNEIEDDQYGLRMSAIDGLGRSSALWPNDLIYNALIDTTTTWIDGQPFFNGSHPLLLQDGAATTQSNLHTTMGLTAANYGTVRARMRGIKGEDNKPIGIGRGRKLLMIVPQALEDTANRIVGADQVGYLSNTASTASDSNIYRGSADVLVLPELDASSTTSWYLVDPFSPIKPFFVQVRQRPSNVVVLDRPTDPNVFDDDMVLFGVKGRGNYGFGLWQAAHKCTA